MRGRKLAEGSRKAPPTSKQCYQESEETFKQQPYIHTNALGCPSNTWSECSGVRITRVRCIRVFVCSDVFACSCVFEFCVRNLSQNQTLDPKPFVSEVFRVEVQHRVRPVRNICSECVRKMCVRVFDHVRVFDCVRY